MAQTDLDRHVTLTTARSENARETAAGMASIFMESFPHSVREMFGRRRPDPAAMTDLYTFIIRTEPEAVQLAWESPLRPRLCGYAVTPRSMPRLWLRAAFTLAWLPWVVRFLSGRYGLGLDALPRILRSKLAFARSFRPENRTAAQILSVAVAPDRRGRGIGRALVERGLDYLRRRGVPRVKLEVLDDNVPARRLYESLGFRPAGAVPYGRRHWIIMLKDLNPPRF